MYGYLKSPTTPLLVWCAVIGFATASLESTGTAAATVATHPTFTASTAVHAEHLPIVEVTVFKDGHAFVLCEGRVPVDEAGTVVLDHLPAPVLGTFWPYAAEPGVTLRNVVAGRKQVPTERPALSIRDLLEANKGSLVHIHEVDGRDYEATILDLPQPRPEPNGTKPNTTGPQPSTPEPGRIVLLQTHGQTKAVHIERIRDISFRQEPQTSLQTEESRGVLTLSLASPPGEALKEARVGMVYLQKGLRWIPNYKVEIDGKGNATVKLQATLINELADLSSARVQLVVGVPTFAFKDSLDPMSLQEAAAQLGQHFRHNSQTAFAFSNAIMSQTAVYEPHSASPAQPSGPGLGPDLPEGAKSEDLFIFTLENISLAKGERMVVPVAEYTIPYKDVYVLEIPFAPPVEVVRSLEGRNPQELQNARLMAGPKVMHKLRMANNTRHPFTTAPALIVQNGRALGQGMMTYTAVGGSSDLELTVAVDVRATKSEVETERVPNAMNWNTVSLARIDLSGTISLANNGDGPIDLEVVRHVLGHVDAAEQDGGVAQSNAREDGWGIAAQPEWFRWHSWPWWWHHVNGIGRIRWDVHLEPGQNVELKYTWHYFWG